MAKVKKETEIKKTQKDVKISPINRFNILFIDLQILFTISTVCCFVWYLFSNKALPFLQASLGFCMIASGYNNKIIYNKEKMMYVYIVLGIVLLILDLLMILGV